MKARTLLSHGFYRITEREARMLNRGKLPKRGTEALVHDGGWRMESGRMVLR